ncbi:MAG: hypothetical protein ACOYLQ_09500 [Hyphomicrobiaceae bacterium]
MPRYSVAEAGPTEVWSRRSNVAYFARFAPGVAATVQLEIQIDGEWLPADSYLTGTMSFVKFVDAPASSPLRYRWNVLAISGGAIELWLG